MNDKDLQGLMAFNHALTLNAVMNAFQGIPKPMDAAIRQTRTGMMLSGQAIPRAATTTDERNLAEAMKRGGA